MKTRNLTQFFLFLLIFLGTYRCPSLAFFSFLQPLSQCVEILICFFYPSLAIFSIGGFQIQQQTLTRILISLAYAKGIIHPHRKGSLLPPNTPIKKKDLLFYVELTAHPHHVDCGKNLSTCILKKKIYTAVEIRTCISDPGSLNSPIIFLFVFNFVAVAAKVSSRTNGCRPEQTNAALHHHKNTHLSDWDVHKRRTSTPPFGTFP